MRELVISSPAKKNAISTTVLESLASSLREAADEPILLTGAGNVFSAGLDLTEVASFDLTRARRMFVALESLVQVLFDHPAPTVALVNGHAIAGGCILALCCDVRVATLDPSARIGLNEVALGVEFPPRVMALVRYRLSPAAAERAVLGSQLLDPVGAREAGLLDEVTSDAAAVARARLEALARFPRASYAAAKAALHRDALAVPEAELQRFEAESLARWVSERTRSAALRALGR
ncbi:MAG TPA: enoyl-CoA hydratase/isomerase family protein [Anaeromyxobacteraceae bacterium]|nr:enoyl-CoA hydratase/isomerase family protein [Anaeromyxobacteraceae bacterium]